MRKLIFLIQYQTLLMEYSSSKPLSMQVFKTSAEFKALRLNRTEQTRLKCTQSFISREERNFHKDFRSYRSQVENQFLRRLSDQDCGGAPATPIPWSTTTTPRVTPRITSALSSRRASALASARRTRILSLPQSMTRSRLLHRRCQTCRGGSARHPLVSRPDTGRSSVVRDRYMNDCDFCDHSSSAVESHKSWVSDLQQDRKSLGHYQGVTGGPETGGEFQHDNAEKPNTQSESIETMQNKALQVRIGNTDTPKINCNEPTTETHQSCIKTANTNRSRNYLKTATPTTGGFSGVADRARSASVVSSSNAQEKVFPEEKGEEESGLGSDQQENECGKSERKVSILPPSTKGVSVILQTPAPSDVPSSPNPTEDIEPQHTLLQHDPKCQAVDADTAPDNSAFCGTYRAMSVAFVDDFRGHSGPGQALLQERVSHFMQEQKMFNRRFPLNSSEVKTLESVRPDLLRNSRRVQREQEKTRSKVKQEMIAEVLEKLGMENHDTGVVENKQSFPPLM